MYSFTRSTPKKTILPEFKQLGFYQSLTNLENGNTQHQPFLYFDMGERKYPTQAHWKTEI